MGVWVLVLAEMCVFATFFVLFAIDRSEDLATFEESRRSLHVTLGLLNTLLLLSSSYAVASGVAAARAHDRAAPGRFALAATCGLLFLLNKAAEYTLEVGDGHTPATNQFFQYFFAYTGIHAVHVAIGVVLLLYTWRITSSGWHPHETVMRRAECVATFWHMVDLVWVVLFTLFYLV